MASTALQMISAAKSNKPLKGFSLIEIVVVLGIIGLVISGAFGLMVYSSDERILRNTSAEIELMAKRARTISILHQTPYALEFREGVVRLLPLAQAGLTEKKNRRNSPEPEAGNDDENRQLSLPSEMALLIRRWNSEKWLPTLKQTVHVWRFDPDGLCEPISVRLALDKSWEEDIYHPLTATIRDSQLEAQ